MFCHRQQISDSNADFESIYVVGDRVRCVIVSIDRPEKGEKRDSKWKISVTMKVSVFEQYGHNSMLDVPEDLVESDDESMEPVPLVLPLAEPSPMTDEFDFASALAEATSNSFLAPVSTSQSIEPMQSIDELLLRKEEDDRPTDFERQLLENPRDAAVYRRYVQHLVSIHEIDRARQIADRALKSCVSVMSTSADQLGQLDQQRIELHLLYLGIEAFHGNAQLLADRIRHARPYCDELQLLLRLDSLLHRASKSSRWITESFIDTNIWAPLLKKHGTDLRVWIQYLSFKARHSLQSARELMPKALQRLEKRDRP